MRSIIFIFTILLLAAACEQETITSLETNTAVVDAYLYAGQPVDSIQITQSFSYARPEEGLITLDDLVVNLFDGEKNYTLTNSGNGFYRSEDLIIEAGRSYSLDFQFNGETVSAETFIPSVRNAEISNDRIDMEKVSAGFGANPSFFSLEPIEVSWNNPERDHYYVVVENIEDDPEYVNEIFADPDNPRRRFQIITEPEVTDFYTVDPRREITQFGTHQVIIFRVNPEYAALYQLSGSSSVSITQPPSNINNGLGIFTGVSSDTLYFEVNKI